MTGRLSVICRWLRLPDATGLYFDYEVATAASSGTYSSKSPGWQSSVWQMASSVVKRTALALLCLRIDGLDRVMFNRSALLHNQTFSTTTLAVINQHKQVRPRIIVAHVNSGFVRSIAEGKLINHFAERIVYP